MKLPISAFFTGLVALACDCSEPPAVCTRINETRVLFVGDILDSNDDGTGTWAQMTLQRVRVVESFKGLPEGTQEVWLDPGSNSSCYAPRAVGKRYLVDASWIEKARPNIANVSRNHKGERKPLPVGFDPKSAVIVYAPACSASLADARQEDIRYLRAWKSGTWQTRIDGQIAYVDQTPVPGVRIQISGAGREYKLTTNELGRFEVPDAPPGEYTLRYEKPGYFFISLLRSSHHVTVPPGGCGLTKVSANVAR